jgi:GNAT superfamily N-acetyltransferase
MSAAYCIVAACDHHVAAIPGIEHAAASLFPTSDLPEEIRYLATGIGELKAAQREGRLWVATTASDLPVGFAQLTSMDGEAHLDEMNVHPDHGRQGLGTRLIDAAREWAIDNGYSQLTLITFEHLPWNAPFYAARGFSTVPPHAIGNDLSTLLVEEAALGIDVSRRVVMRLQL